MTISTYLSFLFVSILSFNLLILYFCGPVGIDLQDELLSLLVHDLDLTCLICLGHGQLYLDISLSFLTINVALVKFDCFVEKGGEESACLVGGEVACAKQTELLHGGDAAGLEQ